MPSNLASGDVRAPKCPGSRRQHTAALAEMYGHLVPGPDWYDSAKRHVLHIMLSDCRSLEDHLNVEVPAKVQGKRLQIEFEAFQQAIFFDDGSRTVAAYPD